MKNDYKAVFQYLNQSIKLSFVSMYTQIKIKGIYQPDTIAKWYQHLGFQTVLTNGPLH